MKKKKDPCNDCSYRLYYENDLVLWKKIKESERRNQVILWERLAQLKYKMELAIKEDDDQI